MSLLRRAFERRTIQQFGDSSIPTNSSLSMPSAAGVPVNDQTAMKLTAVYACVRILANTLGSLPMNAMQDRDGITVPAPVQPTIVTDPFGGASTARWLTRREGMKQLAVSAALRGNGYGVVTARDYLFRPSRILIAHPDVVKVGTDDDGGRTYEVNRETVNPIDMVHVMGLAMPGSPVGMSPIAYARQAIGLGLAAEEFGARFFANGAHMSGLITTDAAMDRARARQMKEAWEASQSGLKNAHAVGILSGGAKWEKISVTPEEAQFLGTRAAQNLDVAMLFGIPPHMIGQVDRTTSWGTGIEQQGIGFLTYTFADWLCMFEDAWTAMLPRGTTAVIDTTALQRTDTAGRMAGYVQARTAGVLTQNEARGKENLPPVEGGDDINAPLNSAHSGGDTPPQPPEPSEEP